MQADRQIYRLTHMKPEEEISRREQILMPRVSPIYLAGIFHIAIPIRLGNETRLARKLHIQIGKNRVQTALDPIGHVLHLRAGILVAVSQRMGIPKSQERLDSQIGIRMGIDQGVL